MGSGVLVDVLVLLVLEVVVDVLDVDMLVVVVLLVVEIPPHTPPVQTSSNVIGLPSSHTVPSAASSAMQIPATQIF